MQLRYTCKRKNWLSRPALCLVERRDSKTEHAHFFFILIFTAFVRINKHWKPPTPIPVLTVRPAGRRPHGAGFGPAPRPRGTWDPLGPGVFTPRGSPAFPEERVCCVFEARQSLPPHVFHCWGRWSLTKLMLGRAAFPWKGPGGAGRPAGCPCSCTGVPVEKVRGPLNLCCL